MLQVFIRTSRITNIPLNFPRCTQKLEKRYFYRLALKQLTHHVISKRNIFGVDPTKILGGDRSKEYSETKVIGYSMEQLYDVVANVDDYKYFVPWCRKSEVFEKSESHARANLEVGFPPVSEKYTSVLTLARPNFVKSECLDGALFNHLLCIWKINQGPKNIQNTCSLNFYISFEFKSLLHSQLSALFFDEVVRQMVKAFEDRCKTMYGPSSLTNGIDNKKRKNSAITKSSLRKKHDEIIAARKAGQTGSR